VLLHSPRAGVRFFGCLSSGLQLERFAVTDGKASRFYDFFNAFVRAENAAVWKAHGEGLGKYNADDPTYDAAFAHEIEAELEDIASQEKQLAEHNIAAVIRSYSRPTDPSDTSTEAEREAHSLSAEIHHLMHKKPMGPNNSADASSEDASSVEDDGTSTQHLNKPITKRELQSAISQIKNYRAAAGEDKIQGEFLKYLGKVGVRAILALFNLILEYQLCPASWCKDMWHGPYTRQGLSWAGDKRDPGNYRLITLMSVIGKLYSSAS
jgi:hypothetical protein